MRKAANLAIAAASLGLGLQYALEGRWWGFIACGLTGALWLFQSKDADDLVPASCFIFLTGLCGAGFLLEFNGLWLLTNLVVILIAWDLDRFSRDLQRFPTDQTSSKDEPALFRAHLQRLAVVVILGWSLGVVALRLQVALSFAGALILVTLALLGLRLVIHYFGRRRSQEEP